MALKTGPMVEELELLGCIQCGKCTGGCPVARKTVLNIRSLIYHMLVEQTWTWARIRSYGTAPAVSPVSSDVPRMCSQLS